MRQARRCEWDEQPLDNVACSYGIGMLFCHRFVVNYSLRRGFEHSESVSDHALDCSIAFESVADIRFVGVARPNGRLDGTGCPRPSCQLLPMGR